MTRTVRRVQDGAIVCERCRVADTFWLRFRGLMLRRTLEPGEGMLFERTGSIHMFFMRMSLDVVFCDAELRVVNVVRELRPWRTASARGAKTTIELAAGAAGDLEPGDRLELV